MGRFSGFLESFREVLWITKNTVSTFWFWLPIAYMMYVIFQLWLMFFVHPLTLGILPVILLIYGIRNENKRIRARYGLSNTPRKRAKDGLGATPEPASKFEWEVEQAVERYEELLKKEKEEEQ